MTNQTFTTIDLDALDGVHGGAEGWEQWLGDAGGAAGGLGGGFIGSGIAPGIGTAIGTVGGAVGGGALGRSIGRSIDNPGPPPTGGVNGGNGAEQVSP